MVEPPDHYIRHWGFEPTARQRRTLEAYSQSGVYRAGRASEPLLAIGREVASNEVGAFFSRDAEVFLVLQEGGRTSFYRNGELIRTLEHYDIWSESPWLVTDIFGCGGNTAYAARLDVSSARPLIRIETPLPSIRLYDPRTGELARVESPPSPPAVLASDPEAALSALVALLSERTIEGSPLWVTEEMRRRAAPIVLEDCWNFVPPGDSDYGDEDETTASLGPSAVELASLGIETAFGARVRHSRSAQHDLYRIAPGSGMKFACGKSLDGRDLAEAVLGLSAESGVATLDDLLRDWQGPLVATTTIWPPGEEMRDELDDLFGQLGVLTLWTNRTGEWRWIARSVFAIPNEQAIE